MSTWDPTGQQPPPDGQDPPQPPQQPPPIYGAQPAPGYYGPPPYQGYPQPPYGGYPQPPYGQMPPPYGQVPPPYGQGPYHPYPIQQGTNGFAIASLVCAFLCNLLGIIFGFVALSQIKQSGQSGRGLAIAGIVLSISFFVISIIFLAAVDDWSQANASPAY